MLSALQILTLLNLPRIGRKTVYQILRQVNYSPSNEDDLLSIILETKRVNTRIPLTSYDEIKRAGDNARDVTNKAKISEISIIGYDDTIFPKQFQNIPDPPVLLYVKGNISNLQQDMSVAVVGTREPTPFGKKASYRFGEFFGKLSWIVVSGLAKGCDTEAHSGCIDSTGRTIAILANGVDNIYPKENKYLADRILESGGCLISEYPPGESPHKNYFIDRDRLQSGFSKGVIVIETDVKGGTMHTARFCIKQSKILGCVVHPEIYSANPKTFGNKLLLNEENAVPIKDIYDLETFVKQMSRKNEELPALDIDLEADESKKSLYTGKQMTFFQLNGDE